MAFAQGEFTLYNLNRSVPQAHQLNPAFRTDYGVMFGLPVISSTHLSFNGDQLTFNNLFSSNADGNYELDFDKIASSLKDQNYLSLNSDVQLLFYGMNIKKNFFSLAFNERISSVFTYSGDIATLAIMGNANENIYGQNIALDKLMIKQNAYHEIALGYAREISDKLTLGILLKYLMGIAASESEAINGVARTSDEQIYINHPGFSAYTAGEAFFDDENDMVKLITNTLPGKNKNTGWAVDLGLNYNITNRLSVSAAVNDLGYINWKSDTREYRFNPVEYSFDGFEILQTLNEDDDEDVFQDELDKLETLFTPDEFEDVSFRSSLTTSANLSVNYEFYRNNHVGIQAYGRMVEGIVQPEFAAYYNYSPARIFNGVINMGMRNGEISMLGIGASVDIGGLQIYATTESLTNLIKPDDAALLDARVGINFVVGHRRNKEPKAIKEDKTPPPPPPVMVEEEPVEEIVEAIETVEKPVVQPIVKAAAATAVVATVTKPEEPAVVEKPIIKEAVVVEQGDNREELSIGYYVVVGAFKSKNNAAAYSAKLKEKGYSNQYGFLTQKDFYYVYVYNNVGDAEKAKSICDKFKTNNDFNFKNAWLLSVVQ
jgi:cell division septation protein DedD